MTRHFDSLSMANRAYELCRIWSGQGFTGAMRDRMERTERAADYLFRRYKRSAAYAELCRTFGLNP